MKITRLFEELAGLERDGTPTALCTLVETRGSVPQRPGSKMAVREDGSIVGTVGGGALEHAAIRLAGEVLADGAPRLVALDTVGDLGMACGGQVTLFVEPLFGDPPLLVFGAGHIGRELCAMASRAGFRVQVIDERAEWADPDAFPAASAVHCGDPVHLLDALPFGAESYVVLVSHSHAVDQRILAAALERDWRYLGMIASKRKKAQVFRELEADGADPARLARVHAPIGLKIGGPEPAEIAVSILAELIRVRHGVAEDPATAF